MNTRVVTFGCRLNSFESEVMRGHAAAAGLEDTVIVHTCAVTAEAERQARQAIRRARREQPAARIVVTGCSAQIEPERYAAMPEVDRVVGNDRKLDASLWRELAGGGEAIVVGDIMTVRETAGHLVDGLDGRARAIVQVQNGCDHRCTFCIIPYGRGPSRSVPLGAIVAQTRRLVESGYREVVLTGVDLTSYGKDLPGQPSARPDGQAPAAPGAGARAPAPVLDRPRRGRPRPARPGGRRAAPDAASASERAGGRHADPQAHEAATRTRRRGRSVRPAARAPARDRVRGRSDRGLSDRDRGDVRQHAGAGRGGGPHLSARLPLFGPQGHAGGAHAAGSRGSSARSGRAACGRRASKRWRAISPAGSAGWSRCWSNVAAPAAPRHSRRFASKAQHRRSAA